MHLAWLITKNTKFLVCKFSSNCSEMRSSGTWSGQSLDSENIHNKTSFWGGWMDRQTSTEAKIPKGELVSIVWFALRSTSNMSRKSLISNGYSITSERISIFQVIFLPLQLLRFQDLVQDLVFVSAKCSESPFSSISSGRNVWKPFVSMSAEVLQKHCEHSSWTDGGLTASWALKRDGQNQCTRWIKDLDHRDSCFILVTFGKATPFLRCIRPIEVGRTV